MRNLILLFVAATCLSACAQKPQEQPSNTQNDKEMKTLVTYFSATGTTKKVAEQIAKAANADLFEIEPQDLYTEDDLNWQDKNSRSSVEMQDPSSRPAIAKKLENMADYDVIYVGFPIWWYTAPTIINTFMESYDFAGKTVIPFATSGGSTIDKSCADLKKAYPEVNWKPGKLLNRPTQEEIDNWVK